MAALKRSTTKAVPRSKRSTGALGQVPSQGMWRVAREEQKIARSVALPIRLVAGIREVCCILETGLMN